MTGTEQISGAGTAIARAIAAAMTMGLALALMGWIGALLGLDAGPDHPLGVRLALGAVVTVVVVVIIVILLRRWDHAPLSSIGLTGARDGLRGFLLGTGVVLGAGLVVIGVLTVLGLARWSDVDVPVFLMFLLTNALVALLLEAIPEEISLRGYALSALRGHFSTLTAAVLNIATFLLVPVIALSSLALLERAVGMANSSFALAPGGQAPFMYYLSLAAFGLLLIYARDSTASATIWTCVGAHLAWLTVNRIVLGGAGGINVELGEAAILIFFASYTTAIIIAFSALASRSTGSPSTLLTSGRSDP